MSTTLDDAAFDDPDAPEGYKSAPAKTQYLIAVSVASVVFLFAQFLLPQVVSLYFMPGMMAGGGMMFQMDIPEVHKAAVWRDEIWMPVTRVAAGPGPQTMLKAATLSGEWVEKSELTLPFTPEFLLADGERLWCVANGQVAIVEGRNFSASYPAMKLNAPSNPYLHEGRLRIVDRDAQGVWRVLEFREGEWATIGRVALPRNITPLPPNAPNIAVGVLQNSQELTVIPGDNGPQALFSDGVARWFAESLPVMSDDATESSDAVSALTALQLGPDPWQPCEPMAPARPVRLNGRLALVEVSGPEMGQTLTAYWLEDGKLADFGTMPITLSEHHGVVTVNDRVYVLTDSFPPGEVRVTELTAEGFPATQGGQKKSLFTGVVGEFAKLYAVLFAIPFVLLAIYVPVLHVAMQACRNPRYGFAHQTVRLASIGRRALARGIDTLIFLAPMAVIAAWFYLTSDWDQMVQQMSNDPVSMLTSIGVAVLGFLTYIVLVVVVFGTMEGVLGWSPGKLLCGLRVVRTTLQPVGVLRGIVRHFLLVVDGQFNYLVGGAMVAVLAKQQRLGDLAADSIVVETASLSSDSSHLAPRDELP